MLPSSVRLSAHISYLRWHLAGIMLSTFPSTCVSIPGHDGYRHRKLIVPGKGMQAV